MKKILLFALLVWAGTAFADETEGNDSVDTPKIITDADVEGTKLGFTGIANYLKSSEDGFIWWADDGITDADGQYYQVCYAPDSTTVYFHHLCFGDAWVKGFKYGNEVYVPSNQLVGVDKDGSEMYFSPVVYDNANKRLNIQNTVTFTISENGKKLTMESNADDNLALVTYYTDGRVMWAQKDLTLEWFNDSLITPPATAAKKRYTYSYGFGTMNVWVATEGNDIYFEGLDYIRPHAWVKGTIDSNGNATIPSGQYVGHNGNYINCIYGSPNDDIVFNYDRENDTYTIEDGEKLVIGYPRNNPDFYEDGDISLTYFDLQPGKPAAPDSLVITAPFGPDQEYFSFPVPTLTIEGKPLDESFMSWRFYVDDTLYTFTPENYPCLTEPMTEIPCTYNNLYESEDGMYFIMFGNTFMGEAIYARPEIDRDNVSADIIYDVDGQRYVSDRVYINGAQPTSISMHKVDKDVEPAEYYSIDGRRLAAPQHGLNIVRMSDGTVKKVMMK